MNDDLGDRMKGYEMAEAGRTLMPYLPAMVRLDGKAFHTFTRNLIRPFDERFSTLMVETTKSLVDLTGATIGYTQSDEITLVLYQQSIESQLYFGGRIQKLCSILAGHTSAKFNYLLSKVNLPVDPKAMPVFDCRVWNVPNKTEAANAVLWREQDAIKNSIQMAARSVLSHKQCQDKNGKELREIMLKEHKLDWNEYPDFFKRGSYIQKRKLRATFSPEEIELLPPKHAARTNPKLFVERTEIRRMNMPEFSTVLNREAVVFDGADPHVEASRAFAGVWD